MFELFHALVLLVVGVTAITLFALAIHVLTDKDWDRNRRKMDKPWWP